MDLLIKKNSLKGRVINRLLSFTSLSLKGVLVGKGSVIGAAKVEVGLGTRINGRIVIKGDGEVRIGKYCAIGDGVRVISSNHAKNTLSIQLALQKKLVGKASLMETKSGVTIGNDVWVGDAVIILPGVHVGDGVIIGAGSVVTKDVDPYTITAGNPAKKIGNRFSDELVDMINKLEWWNWSEEEMKNAKHIFAEPLSTLNTSFVAEILIKRTVGDSN